MALLMKAVVTALIGLLFVLPPISSGQNRLTGQTCPQATRLFPVRIDDKWGFINEHGALAVGAQFRKVLPFSEGLAPVWREFPGPLQFLDESGQVALATDAMETQGFSEGLAAVANADGRWGFIDKQGKLAITEKFAEVSSFQEGLAAVRVNGTLSYIDHRGNVVFSVSSADPDLLSDFHGGLAQASSLDGKTGYLNRTGVWRISPQFDGGFDFSEGLAAVQLNNRLGYIDRTGRFRVPARYVAAESFHENLAAVRFQESPAVPSRAGFVDRNGRVAIGFDFEDAGAFCGGLAPVRRDGKWGYINKAGKIVIAPQFHGAAGFSSSLARVYWPSPTGMRSAYIDRTGKRVWVSPNTVQLID